MGYRTLLKKYIQHLELVAGDNYIEAETQERLLSSRDLGELKTLAAEILRDAHSAKEVARIENYNYRLRILANRYGLDAEHIAQLSDETEEMVRRWRTSPKSRHYLPMSETQYRVFEQNLNLWLEAGAVS